MQSKTWQGAPWLTPSTVVTMKWLFPLGHLNMGDQNLGLVSSPSCIGYSLCELNILNLDFVIGKCTYFLGTSHDMMPRAWHLFTKKGLVIIVGAIVVHDELE